MHFDLLSLSAPHWLPLADAIAKATFVLAAAALSSMFLRRASAATRHLVWVLAIVGAIVLPALSLALPRWEVPVIRVQASAAPTGEASAHGSRLSALPIRRASAGAPKAIEPDENVNVAAASPVPSALFSVSWPVALSAVWALGASTVLGRLALGLIAVLIMSRRTQPIESAPWLPLSRQLATEIGITRRVSYRRSRSAAMPMAWGIFRGTVLMPVEADRWPTERLRVVLLHELAHIKRRDCLTHVVAQIGCALYWFNPLAWVAARHVRTERERACDDLVLAAGTRGSEYAAELLEIARAVRTGRFPAVLGAATLAMAHRSQLEGRLMAILDTNIRRSEAGRRHTAACATVLAVALLPLASVQPWVQASAAFDYPTSPDSPLSVDASATTAAQPMSTPSASAAPHAVSRAVEGGVRDGVLQGVPDGVVGGVVGGVAGGLRTGTAGGISGGVAASVVEQAFEAVAQVRNPNSNPIPNPDPDPQTRGGDRKPADPRVVAALTAALKDSDKEVRESAMHALIQLRDPGVFEPLMQALTDGSPDVRRQAAQGLGSLRDRRAVTPLIGALKDKDADVRQQAAFALGQFRDPAAVPELIAALRDADKDVRQQAAFALGQLRDPRSNEALISALKDSDPDVRQQAAFALGQARDARAVEPLIIALKDENADVRQQAAFALGQLRDQRAIDGLTAALKDANAEVRQQAAFALGQIAR